jgi:hypothetical protein
MNCQEATKLLDPVADGATVGPGLAAANEEHNGPTVYSDARIAFNRAHSELFLFIPPPRKIPRGIKLSALQLY